ncbi:MAG: magnesium protoporphyrin IX methyltransferase [Myxococcales bacterium]|nr:magnesium protoporphyrin IX methyltransferase [Myxococcales bacterium]
MKSLSYQRSKSRLEAYFDRTAADTWARLTSTDPVSRIRRTVRAGREEMQRTLLEWLPDDLSGRRVLDAGCGTGSLAVLAASRGASVVAIDLSGTLVGLARARAEEGPWASSIDFRVGDMLEAARERFDFVLAMDSLIHYESKDLVEMVKGLSADGARRTLFTFAPKTPLLAAMHLAGRVAGKLLGGDRAPFIAPVSERHIRKRLFQAIPGASLGRTKRVQRGFYTSQAVEVLPS